MRRLMVVCAVLLVMLSAERDASVRPGGGEPFRQSCPARLAGDCFGPSGHLWRSGWPGGYSGGR